MASSLVMEHPLDQTGQQYYDDTDLATAKKLNPPNKTSGALVKVFGADGDTVNMRNVRHGGAPTASDDGGFPLSHGESGIWLSVADLQAVQFILKSGTPKLIALFYKHKTY